jgi:hypothetical protein
LYSIKLKGRQQHGKRWETWNVCVMSEKDLTVYTVKWIWHEFDTTYVRNPPLQISAA